MTGKALAAVTALAAVAAASPARGWERPIPHEYGRVVLDNFSTRAGVPAVRFDHWSHRARFTCRLCHVDVGFAMTAGETRVSAATNRDHFHCGACHDGKREFRARPIFAACSAERRVDAGGDCRRCHAGAASSAAVQREYDAFAAKLPRDTLGLVDWEKAEAAWLVKPIDYLEGISIARNRMKMDREVALEAKVPWMANVLFSHRKHAVWTGCEVCHPEIFPSTTAGEAHYTMLQIASGGACGACHEKVAFPIKDCDRCHVTRR